jgi:GT2 family glycosyltransferase/glycosyltransferase involved in cell wall biosynthesis
MTPDFDRISRHVLTARAIRGFIDPLGSVLDVGGSNGLTAQELPNYEVTALDPEGGAGVISGSVLDLPFADSSFDAVVGLDLLEHLPRSSRRRALEEMSRVARQVLILAGPFDSPGTLEAENEIAAFAEAISHRAHRWLREHRDFGLPGLASTAEDLRDLGWAVEEHASNPLPMWAELQKLNLMAAELGQRMEQIHKTLLDHYLDGGDGDQPAYRHLVICTRSPAPLQLRRPSPSSLSTAQAVRLLKDAQATLLGEAALDRKRKIRLIEQKDTALDEARRSAREHAEATRRAERDRAYYQRERDAHRSDLEKERSLRQNTENELRQARLERDTNKQRAAAHEEARSNIEQLAAGLREAERKTESVSRAWSEASKVIEEQADRLERSTAWRIGRAVTAPTRMLRPRKKTAPELIRDALRIHSPPGLAASVPSASRRQPDAELQRILTDLRSVTASRRLRAVNLLADLARPASRHQSPTPDREIGRLAEELAQRVSARGDPRDILEASLTQLQRLHRSRRYRLSRQLAGLSRGSGEPAVDRLLRTVPRFLASPASFPAGVDELSIAGAGHTWGVSAAIDRSYMDEVYAQYIRAMEPAALGALAEHAAADFTAIALIDPADADATSPVRLEASRNSVSAAAGGWIEIRSDRVAEDGGMLEGLRRAGRLDEDRFVVFLRPGDVIDARLANGLGSVSSSSAVVFDHDRVDWCGTRRDACLKPGFSPDLLLETDYVGTGVAVKAGAIAAHAKELDEVEPLRDLLLRLWEAGEPIAKVDAVLLHLGPRAEPGLHNRSGLPSKVLARRGAMGALVEHQGSPHVRYTLPDEPLVSIVVPFKDKPELLSDCVASVIRLTTWSRYELVLVDNQSTSPETAQLLGELMKDERVKVIPFDRPFNYSAANNAATREASGDYLVFLNNDTRLLSPDWLHELIGYAAQPGVGAVGAKLFYPNGRVQHAGVVVGLTGFAGHLLSGVHEVTVDDTWTRFTRNCTAVTAACLAVSRSHFDAVGGFDEAFTLTGNDVDFCLRLLKQGLRNVWNPAVELFHFEKETRRAVEVPEADKLLSLERYEPYLSQGDPYFNRQLSLLSPRPLPKTTEEPDADDLRRQLGVRVRTKPPSPVQGFVRSFDASVDDILGNERALDRFRGHRELALESALWFVPAFDHVYRGGIHTIMRIADAMTRHAGTTNHLIVYGESSYGTEEIRGQVEAAFPKMEFELIRCAAEPPLDELPTVEAAFATLWTSAYHLLKFNRTIGKFYLVQDFEPAFQPANAVYALAEQTYRFGFPGIANTPGVADRYRAYGNETTWFVPGVDRTVFHPPDGLGDGEPIRIVFYGRPGNVRNGFELGAEALRRVKSRFGPRVDIRSAGADWDVRDYDLEGTLTNLGVLSDLRAVAGLYRESDIGLVFMFTAHPSYQPFEYMASGCATVTNINESNLWLLHDGENALLTPPTATAVADAISRLVEDVPLRRKVAAGGLDTVREYEWEPQLERIVHWIRTGRDNP